MRLSGRNSQTRGEHEEETTAFAIDRLCVRLPFRDAVLPNNPFGTGTCIGRRCDVRDPRADGRSFSEGETDGREYHGDSSY